ncbi:hypothetical protein D9M68_562880 [compost metagenome]
MATLQQARIMPSDEASVVFEPSTSSYENDVRRIPVTKIISQASLQTEEHSRRDRDRVKPRTLSVVLESLEVIIEVPVICREHQAAADSDLIDDLANGWVGGDGKFHGVT